MYVQMFRLHEHDMGEPRSLRLNPEMTSPGASVEMPPTAQTTRPPPGYTSQEDGIYSARYYEKM